MVGDLGGNPPPSGGFQETSCCEMLLSTYSSWIWQIKSGVVDIQMKYGYKTRGICGMDFHLKTHTSLNAYVGTLLKIKSCFR